jgi:hypothetical protein
MSVSETSSSKSATADATATPQTQRLLGDFSEE